MNGSNWYCSQCGKVLSDYAGVGYDGPARDGRPDPHSDRCSPFMEWMVLCQECAEELTDDESSLLQGA